MIVSTCAVLLTFFRVSSYSNSNISENAFATFSFISFVLVTLSSFVSFILFGFIVIVSTDALVANTFPVESYMDPLFGLII